MLPFWYQKKNKKEKEKFVQEYLYIEDVPLDKIPVTKEEKKDEIERGIVVIEL